MVLLQPEQVREGYPAEYLLARIRARRSRLIRDWRPLLTDPAPLDYLVSGKYRGFIRERTPDALWVNLLKEHRWVYSQMNPALRNLFTPYFLYAELRTLFITLRGLQKKGAGKAEALPLLDQSLLSPKLKRILISSPDRGSAVRQMEPLFLELSSRFSGMGGLYETDGLREFERFIADTTLSVLSEDGLSRPLSDFFARLIDSRNIIRVYKQLRLEQKSEAAFVRGGTVPDERLRSVRGRGDIAAVTDLVRESSGFRIDQPDPTKVEVALYRGITRFLRAEGRDPLGPGLILDYLWRCSLEVMNVNVLFHGRELDREAVAAEIVQ